ncbi:hypothetical protein M6B38_289785 [Iris pallida]|uniref:Uncharacterized protein n=1 Tax=Iris pallida TaxID=29817 RepID=A0AAX6HXV0_IRIPA|nr:hypothetical protein M6B38_289785 [Iris pallida]
MAYINLVLPNRLVTPHNFGAPKSMGEISYFLG